MNLKVKKIKRLIFFLVFVFSSVSNSQTISVGAKNFNEGYLLSEILAQLIEINGFQVERKFNLGGTLICFEALRNREIDLYPEYTGTIAEQILQSDNKIALPDLRDKMKDLFDMEISDPYGFNNT